MRGLNVKVFVESETLRQWFGDADPFAKVRAINGQVAKQKDDRTTQRFEVLGNGFYVKQHRGVGWAEIFKNFLQLKLPVVGATNEWNAIRRLRAHNVNTLNVVAFGKRGLSPAAQESFVITEELADTISLEELTATWRDDCPSVKLKRALIRRVAESTRAIHRAGVNHRDLYICHFLVSKPHLENVQGDEEINLYLIDLHRAQCRKHVPYRWRVKDLGSLFFSAMDIGLTSRDIWRFLQIYFDKPLREIMQEEQALLQACEHRAMRLYRKGRR